MSESDLPKITIVTPSYQQARYLERTIQSVLSQNYPNLEYLVLDGGSKDGSVDIIRKYADRINFWTSEKDNGQSAAINRGMKMATGDIVGWLNSDDTFAPGALRKIGRYYAAHQEVDLLYGHTWLIDSDDKVLRRLVSIQTNAYELIHYTRNIFSQPGTTWRRTLHDKIGYLDESLTYLMDNDWWIRAALNCRMKCIPIHLANLRIHEQTKTSTAQPENVAVEQELSRRYGQMYYSGFALNWWRLRRKIRILRDPRNWLYRLGVTG